MARVVGMVCAAVALCLLAAGCDGLRDYTLSGSALLAAGAGKDRVVAGSLEKVAASTQDSLQQLGIAATSTREGDAVRIAATTKTGQHFSLVLTRAKTDHGEVTHVRFEWDRDRDEGTEMQILSQVEVGGRS